MSDEQQDQATQGAAPWQSAAPSAGWYQDPWDSHRRRYWDGQRWTGNVSFEPPGSWAGQHPEQGPGIPAAGHDAEQQPWVAPQASAAPQHSATAAQQSGQQQGIGPQWPATTVEHPTRTGWGGGGWGQPPQLPDHWAGAPMWQPPVAQPLRADGNRIHVAVVALISAVAVLAGIGIGSQLNSSSATPAASSGGQAGPSAGAGGVSPFGGGTGGVSGGISGSGNLSPAQQAIATKVNRSIVDINTQLSYQNGAAAGTGMVLSSNGFVLTNNHVIDGATSISVTLVSTGKQYKADVVGTDVTEDVAVLQMQGASGLTPISVGDSSAVSRGDQVIALGNAGGAGGTPSAVTGVVNALNQTITASDSNGSNAEVLNGLIQTNAPIQAGDSGGPLVTMKGQVIGMDTAASSSNQINGAASVGFAIPISSASTIASQIQQGKPSDKIHIGQTGFLGVSVDPSGSASALPSGATVAGAAVSKVITSSPAAIAGIVAGDTITGVDNTTVDSATALTATLRSHHPGDQVAVSWTDASGAPHTAKVTLIVGPAA